MLLVQVFLGIKEDALYSLGTTTTSHTTLLLFQILIVETFGVTARGRLRRRHGCLPLPSSAKLSQVFV